MPLNGKTNPVPKPSWLKDSSATTSATATPTRPAWARKLPGDAPVAKKEPEPPKKEVTVKLQSREIKVPLKVEKTIPTMSILKKPDPKPKEEPKEVPVRDIKTPSKSPSKTPSTLSSKSPSTTPSKSPTPSKSTCTTPSKSPSKTPDYDSDEEEESSYESETDSSEESESETDSDEKPSYKPPSPGALRQHLIIPPLKKVTTKSPESTTEPERSQSPDYTFKKPELKKVVTRQKSDAKERTPSPEPKFLKPKLRKVPSSMKVKEPAPREKIPVVELKKAPAKAIPDKLPRKNSEVFPHKPSSLLRADSSKKSESWWWRICCWWWLKPDEHSNWSTFEEDLINQMLVNS